MQPTTEAFTYRGHTLDIAERVPIGVVTQGRILDETMANLREAVDLHLENEEGVGNVRPNA